MKCCKCVLGELHRFGGLGGLIWMKVQQIFRLATVDAVRIANLKIQLSVL